MSVARRWSCYAVCIPGVSNLPIFIEQCRPTILSIIIPIKPTLPMLRVTHSSLMWVTHCSSLTGRFQEIYLLATQYVIEADYNVDLRAVSVERRRNCFVACIQGVSVDEVVFCKLANIYWATLALQQLSIIIPIKSTMLILQVMHIAPIWWEWLESLSKYSVDLNTRSKQKIPS